MQLWRDAIITAFQCRAVDLEKNSCKKDQMHYTWKRGPKAFHDKVSEIVRDQNVTGEHIVHDDDEHDHDHGHAEEVAGAKGKGDKEKDPDE